QTLRIYVAAPELWWDICDEDWGFAYHLERWFHRLLLEHLPAVVTASPDEADFVYIPHCAMNIYLSWKQARHRQASSPEAPEHGEGDQLHSAVLRDVDEKYLTAVVAPAAQQNAAARACVARTPRCRLLFVNMAFGRNELPSFTAAVGDAAVFVTTAGASPRLQGKAWRQASLQGTQWRAQCSCRSHCQPVLSLGPLDIVVPFNTGHNSTSGLTGLGGRRPLLAFFAGSNTSCSRDELVRRWSEEAALREHGVFVSGRSLKEPAFHRMARRSVFCLVPDGHWPATQRLASVVAKGCVPVVVSNRVELPWDDLVDWRQASLWLPESTIRELPEVLRRIGRQEIQSLQAHLPLLAEALDYHSTRFHLLLLASLAARRNTPPEGAL
ncbi:unnamed protein product, partial [Polarella glacialis]